MLNDGNVTVAAIVVVVRPASWLSRGLAGRRNPVTIRISDTPFQIESLPHDRHVALPGNRPVLPVGTDPPVRLIRPAPLPVKISVMDREPHLPRITRLSFSSRRSRHNHCDQPLADDFRRAPAVRRSGPPTRGWLRLSPGTTYSAGRQQRLHHRGLPQDRRGGPGHHRRHHAFCNESHGRHPADESLRWENGFGLSESQIARRVQVIAKTAGLPGWELSSRPYRAHLRGPAHHSKRRFHPPDGAPGHWKQGGGMVGAPVPVIRTLEKRRYPTG